MATTSAKRMRAPPAYCRQFNAAATLQTLQPAGGQRIATY